MKEKLVIKTVIKIIIFSLIAFGILIVLNSIFKPKSNYTKIVKNFYKEPKDSLDVVFVGDSTVYRAISPLEMWKQYGIAGYDFSTPAQKVWDNYYSIKEVLQYQKPKVIVLDVDAFFKSKPMGVGNSTHLYCNMNIGMPKLEGMFDPVQNKSIKRQVSLLFPAIRFHSRWSELEKDDFSYDQNEKNAVFKGFLAVKKIKKFKTTKTPVEGPFIPNNVKTYLKKIKDEVSKNNCQLLLVSIPNPKFWNEQKIHSIERWAQANQVPFLDMNTLQELSMDWKKDTSDYGTHLNINGAKKVSNYLGNYLKLNYNLKDHRIDKEYEQWNHELQEYEKYLNPKK